MGRSITKQIQLLERNWMQRAAQALARDQTKLMQICYKSLGPTHRKVPDNIRLLWIQYAKSPHSRAPDG
jgi:hypothetical protein